MTSTASIGAVPRPAARAVSYQYAHWYFLAALAVTVGGFWSSFFRRPGAGDFWHSLHGITATLWIVALAAQSWLMSRGRVQWHRRVAAGVLVLLPILVISALYMVGVMLRNPEMPPFLPPFLAFIDLPSVAFLIVLVVLALRNVRTPAAHKRFMSATVLLGLPPALTRLYARALFPQVDLMIAFQASLFSVEVILIALIVTDWRAGERRLAYPLCLMFFATVHALIVPVSSSTTWRAAMAWYGSLSVLAASQVPTPPPAAAQNPSPMAEETRVHERLVQRDLGGTTRSFVGPAEKPVDLWVPDRAPLGDVFDLVIHFHGIAWLPEQAIAGLGNGTVAAVVNLGTGSGGYQRAFTDATAFDSLIASATREVSAVTGRASRVGRVTLVGFSAGYGAVRAILREPRHFATVNAVLLLDGLHTSYVPEGAVLAAGGALDSANLMTFAEFARASVRGEKRFLVTHSEIFPGTFASTTETTGWLLRALGLRRKPVLSWGPRGMQQLSEVRAGGFELLGFAGNSAPDHVDHLHAMPELLSRLLKR